MMKHVKAIVVSLSACLVFFSPQVQGQEGESAWKEAEALFEEGNYRQAHALFSGMESTGVLADYYTGRCLIEMNEDLPEAIELLFGASRKGVGADVDYYLGLAHHRNYNFKEALRYYQRYENKASRQDIRTHQLKQKMLSCRSASSLTSSYNPYEVMTVAFVNMDDSTEFQQIKMKGGDLVRKPAEYLKEGERGVEALMFMPRNPVRGDFIYYSSMGRQEKEGSEIFRVRKGAGRAWGDPEPVKELNTEGNELLPYFDPIENDLYFASDGGEGIGGYDLYRSHYDADRDTWTDAVNLGFPVNSAMDEFLLLPGTDLGMMMFFSNRQGTDSSLTVYRVHLVEPKQRTDVNDYARMHEIANLGGVAAKLLAELNPPVGKESAVPAGAAAYAAIETLGQDQDQEYTEVRIMDREGSRESSAVKVIKASPSILADALAHQARSDSLKDLATTARLRVRESEDPNDRWVWQKQILVWEKRANDEEALADALYAMLDMPAGSNPAGASVNPPEPLPAVQINGEERLSDEPGSQPEVVRGREALPAVMNRFDVLSSSPYSRDNPIPVDLPLPDGVYYRIQLGAYGKAVEPSTFKGISPVTADTDAERGILKYYAGKFSLYAEASKALERIRNEGYEDAFIVSWYNGNPVSTQKAKQLE